ncbi:hypothetical protein CRYUN_Cryun12cG0058200 [Craigia yunnanensis]
MASFKLFLFFSFLFFFLQPSKGNERCRKGCGTVPIRFPFQMISSLPEYRCGYPGFTVICESETQNILIFPLSGEFKIASIAYMSQLIWISDPSNCTAKCLLQGFNYSDTPFHPLYTRNFTFLNCTTDAPIFQSARVSPIPCLSSESYSVVALPTDRYNVSDMLRCMEITTFLYPSWGPGDSSDSLDDITLTWKEPDCQRCESIGGNCQFEDDMGSDVGCFKPLDPGFPAIARYAALFVVASGLCIFWLIICVQRKIHRHRGQSQPNSEISDSTYTTQLGNVVAAKGLDRPTIEMYPTTLVGESDPAGCLAKRLLKGFDPSGTPFVQLYLLNFTLLNCSTDIPTLLPSEVTLVSCLSGENNHVVAIPVDRPDLSKSFSSCLKIGMVSLSVPESSKVWEYLSDRIWLTCKERDCKWCLRNQGTCQFKKNGGLEVGCSVAIYHGMLYFMLSDSTYSHF